MRSLKKAVEDANKELESTESKEFSFPGFEKYKDSIDNYIFSLCEESKRNSIRDNQEHISSLHVEKAANYLAQTKAKNNLSILDTIGGLLLGTSISN